MSMTSERGKLALSGQEEYLPSHLFPKAEEDTWVTGRGTLIVVFDPDAPENTIPVWKWREVDKYGTGRVPKGCRVKVLHGWVKMSTSAPG
ncbi:hypothetical protein I7I48_02708 [Histoplasma ohiense]|nr:hypothetical protein I7I48_02708 [Histoplasma ohiense (nom. inval.)]